MNVKGAFIHVIRIKAIKVLFGHTERCDSKCLNCCVFYNTMNGKYVTYSFSRLQGYICHRDTIHLGVLSIVGKDA